METSPLKVVDILPPSAVEFIPDDTGEDPLSDDVDETSKCLTVAETENEILEKQLKCVKCTDKPRKAALLPCCVCRGCSEPVCNQTILATVDTLFVEKKIDVQ